MMKNLTSKGSNLIERHVKLASLGDGHSLLADHPNAFTALNSIKCEAPLHCEVRDHALVVGIDPQVLTGQNVRLDKLNTEIRETWNNLERTNSNIRELRSHLIDLDKKLVTLESSANEELNNSSRYVEARFADTNTDICNLFDSLHYLTLDLNACRSEIPDISSLDQKYNGLMPTLITQGIRIKYLTLIVPVSLIFSIVAILWSVFK